METWDAIRARRNVRQYTDQPVARVDLERVLEAGRRAPSSTNWQPWHFVAVTDRKQLRELAEVWRGAGHVATSQATIALVATEPEDDMHARWLQYDFGQTTAYMMLEAADLGIGSGHAAVGDQAEARRVLGFPEGHFCPYLIALGYPAERPLRPVRHPNRRPFDDVVHWDRF
ncbi:MAG: nitroreductase family protein [Acidimicrobiales bacterium]